MAEQQVEKKTESTGSGLVKDRKSMDKKIADIFFTIYARVRELSQSRGELKLCAYCGKSGKSEQLYIPNSCDCYKAGHFFQGDFLRILQHEVKNDPCLTEKHFDGFCKSCFDKIIATTSVYKKIDWAEFERQCVAGGSLPDVFIRTFCMSCFSCSKTWDEEKICLVKQTGDEGIEEGECSDSDEGDEGSDPNPATEHVEQVDNTENTQSAKKRKCQDENSGKKSKLSRENEEANFEKKTDEEEMVTREPEPVCEEMLTREPEPVGEEITEVAPEVTQEITEDTQEITEITQITPEAVGKEIKNVIEDIVKTAIETVEKLNEGVDATIKELDKEFNKDEEMKGPVITSVNVSGGEAGECGVEVVEAGKKRGEPEYETISDDEGDCETGETDETVETVETLH